MKDLTNFKNPIDFEIRETCDVNASFIRHIPYKPTFIEVSNDKYYEEAIKELIARYAKSINDNFILAQFADEGIGGADKVILTAFKSSINIIAAILSEMDISVFYDVEDTAYTDLDKFIDHIIINAITFNDVDGQLFVSIGFNKLFPDGTDSFLYPIEVKSFIPLINIKDKLRGKDLYTAGDTVYQIIVGNRPYNPSNAAPVFIENATRLADNISLRSKSTLTLIHCLLKNNAKSSCSTCRGNKYGNVECLGNFILKDKEFANQIIKPLTDNYALEINDEKNWFGITIHKDDVGGFNRFSVVGRRIVEYSLMLDDYLNTPEVVEVNIQQPVKSEEVDLTVEAKQEDKPKTTKKTTKKRSTKTKTE